jgi:hypothetical protein
MMFYDSGMVEIIHTGPHGHLDKSRMIITRVTMNVTGNDLLQDVLAWGRRSNAALFLGES